MIGAFMAGYSLWPFNTKKMKHAVKKILFANPEIEMEVIVSTWGHCCYSNGDGKISWWLTNWTHQRILSLGDSRLSLDESGRIIHCLLNDVTVTDTSDWRSLTPPELVIAGAQHDMRQYQKAGFKPFWPDF